MKCKKEVMGLAALMVLFFHFYIAFGNSPFETFVYRSTYIGVDMFFFVSAYSIASREKKTKFKFGEFIFNRLELIYVPFVVLSLINTIVHKKEISTFFQNIFGVEFYQRGGGSYLWYFIGIMLIYLMVPFFFLVKKHLKVLGFPVLIGFWILLSVILWQGLNYGKMFILINRLPIFFIGLYYDELIRDNLKKINKIYVVLIDIALLVSGVILVNKFGILYRVNKPFPDMYYVIAIPLTLGVIMLIDIITTSLESKYKSVVLKFIGGITLELYGLQMTFGYDIERFLLKYVPVNQLAFVGTVIALILLAVVFNQILINARKLKKLIPLKAKEN